ncbi:MAG: response regulator [Rhodoferax sp.]
MPNTPKNAFPDPASSRMVAAPLILVVDDQAKNSRLLQVILEPAGYTVITAGSGAVALQMAQSRLPALVLLDVMMPGMDGFAVCQRLKQIESTRQIPVIFVTAGDDPQAESRGLALGAVDFVAKPINLAVLLARVKTHLALDG